MVQEDAVPERRLTAREAVGGIYGTREANTAAEEATVSSGVFVLAIGTARGAYGGSVDQEIVFGLR